MRSLARLSQAHRRVLFCICVAAVLMAGCGDSSGVGKTLPVSGKVTVLAQPVTSGSVAFFPDESKGNTSKVVPAATIGSDGAYTLKSNGKNGAPPGWYKVVIVADEAVDNTNPTPAKSPISPLFKSAKTTPLSLEVKEGAAANAYDLSLSK